MRLFVIALVLLTVPANAALWVFAEDLPPFWRGMEQEKDRDDLVARLDGTITVNGFGSWQNMPATGTLNEDGSPFWDQPTWDSPGYGRNPGFFMTGTGAWAGDPRSPSLPAASIQYYGTGAGGPIQSFGFESAGPVTVTLLAKMAAFASLTQFYWVDSASLAHLLFAGSAVPGATATFSPNGEFSFLLKSPLGDFSTTQWGGQFAFVRDGAAPPPPPPPPPEPIPEPATMTMMGVGLAGLALTHHGRRKT